MISKTTCPSIEVLAALLCATTASAQDNRGTPEQRAACTPDALRLCGSYIPDQRSNACGRTYPAAAESADRCSNQPLGRS
jgi:hypothetical protein